jgi:hypothetical protein
MWGIAEEKLNVQASLKTHLFTTVCSLSVYSRLDSFLFSCFDCLLHVKYKVDFKKWHGCGNIKNVSKLGSKQLQSSFGLRF